MYSVAGQEVVMIDFLLTLLLRRDVDNMITAVEYHIGYGKPQSDNFCESCSWC